MDTTLADVAQSYDSRAGIEKENKPSSTIARAERAERLRDYFDLQLRFAEAVVVTAALPLFIIEICTPCTPWLEKLGGKLA